MTEDPSADRDAGNENHHPETDDKPSVADYQATKMF
jgi:hypothetical protein